MVIDLKKKEGEAVTKNNSNDGVNFLSEISVLKRTPRLGWREAGLPLGEDSVAAHIAITAQITFYLGIMEGLKKRELFKAVVEAVFHDNMETRIDDREKLSLSYFSTPTEVVEEALEDQVNKLPVLAQEIIMELVMEANYEETKIGTIVRDADVLESALATKIADERGYKIPGIEERFKLYQEKLETESAKKTLEQISSKEKLSVYLAEELFRRTNPDQKGGL